MDNCFRLTSLCIDIGEKGANPTADTLLWPAEHEPRISRVVFHESVHYWQSLIHGFTTRLAAEELARLKEYETTGNILPPGPVKREFRQVYDVVGFSAEQLQESLARYWDVHVIGPHRLLKLDLADPSRRISDEVRERYQYLNDNGLLTMQDGSYTDKAFDLAMDAAAGSYARPYKVVRDIYPPGVAAGIFPIAGAFALKTTRPAPFFARLIHMAAPLFQSVSFRSIHDIWQEKYFPIAGLAVKLAAELGEELTSSVIAYQESNLKEYIPHHFAAHERQSAIDGLMESDEVKAISAKRGGNPQYLAVHALERRLACPGDPNNRAFLAYWLSPPCIRFVDGMEWLPSYAVRREAFPEINDFEKRLKQSREEVALEVANLDERWKTFIKASIRSPHKPQPKCALLSPEDVAFLTATRAILRAARNKNSDYGNWFHDLIFNYPTPSAEFYAFISRHLGLGTIRAKDIQSVNQMICIQLASKSGLTEYHSESGYEFEWDGQPVQMALAAALGRHASTIIDSDEMMTECSAILLRSLDIFVEIAGERLAGSLEEATNNIRQFLHAQLNDNPALEQVDNLIKKYRTQL